MKIEPSGVIFSDVCSIQSDRCVARQLSSPVTAVWGTPRMQINVCRPCLEEMVRLGEWEIPGRRILRRADVAAYARGGTPILVAEVRKSAEVKTPLRESAIRIHRNLIMHSGIPGTPYFLLALLPDHLYFWKGNGDAGAEREPDYEINAPEILNHYFALIAATPDRANRSQLETVIKLWLKDVAAAEESAETVPAWLRESGLSDALKNSSVEMETAIAA